MLDVATHLSGAAGHSAHQSPLISPSSRVDSTSDGTPALNFVEEPAEPPSLASGGFDRGFQTMAEEEISAEGKAAAKSESGKAGPDPAVVSEPPLTESTSEGDQALDSSAGQAEDAEVQAGDHPTPFIHKGGDNQSACDGADDVQQVLASPDVVADGETAADAPSPASSSEDAPGSDYDETEQRGLPMDATMLADTENRESSNEPLCEQLAAHQPSFIDEGQAEAEKVDEGDLQHIEDIDSVSKQDQPAKTAATLGESEQTIFQTGGGEIVQGGLNLMADTIVGEIEHGVKVPKEDTPVIYEASQGAHLASTPVQCEAENITTFTEPPRSPTSTNRPAEDGAPLPSKRPKLDHTVSTSEPTGLIDGDSTVAAFASKKQPVRKSAKPFTKPKAPLNPKKVPQAKGKKVVAQAALKEEDAKPEIIPDLSLADTAAIPSSKRTFVPDQVEPTTGQKSEAEGKKARKSPIRPRRQPAETNATIPRESAQTGTRGEISVSSAAPIDSSLMHVAAQPEVFESGPAAPEVEVKPKGKGKPKAPSKAKGKAQAVPAEAALEPGSAVPVSLAPIALSPSKKPTPKRTAAKKGKGRVAQLRPAQADGAVSELELEPVQPLPGISSFHSGSGPSQGDGRAGEKDAYSAIQPSEHGARTKYRSTQDQQQQHATNASVPALPTLNSGYTSSNIFTSMPPPQYPAQAYWPTRAEILQHQNRALSTLTNAAASMLQSETPWSSEATSANVAGSSSSVTYEGTQEATSPTTVGNPAGSVAGDDISEADNSISPAEAFYKWELDPRIHPTGWRLPHFDVIDPDLLMTSMRDSTVWTFWDCYLPLGCRDQDMVLLSNDNVAFPCAAWNPCLFSTMLKRVIKNPNRVVAQILERSVEENRKKLGYKPLPCIWIDENWQATNLLLSFLHPIPTMFLPDRTTCRLVMDLGLRYGVDRAIAAATSRTHQIDEEDKRAASEKGKGPAREEEIAAAERAQRAA